MKKGLSLNFLLLTSLFFLIFLGVGYKITERKSLKTISEIHTRVVPAELTGVEKNSKNGLAIAELIGKLYAKKPPPFEEQLKILDEIDGQVNLNIGYVKEYLTNLEKDKKEFENLIFVSKFLFGRPGDFLRKFLENRLNYYKEETEAANQGIVEGYLVKNIFTVARDKIIMNKFDKKASGSPKTNYPKYFADIATLEKYTNNSFKFPEEDKIKELYPYGYETLINNKNYMNAYYSVVKDYVAEDYESALYKYSRIQEGYLKLNVDFDRLFGERDEENKEKAKRIIEYVANAIKAIKDFRMNNLGLYPLLPRIDSFKEDLELCQLYSYKTGLYFNTLKKYPKASDSATLVEELTQLPPSTSVVDDKFDMNVLNYTNNDELIKFECVDKQANKTYTFEIRKN